MNRRGFLQGFGAVMLWAGLPPLAKSAWAQAEGLSFGPALPFSFEALQQQARDLAGRRFQPRPIKADATLESIDFDTHQKLRYRKDKALWGGAERPHGVQFFHLHRWVRQGVKIHVLEDGQARG
ncbi:MAG TPA: glucan biosynthesis protein D, partial [Gammaproteobacteria bacterium]|nr:glucan biosynthesis protein D [Gammaproteobacteria bacterium]